MGAMGLCGRSHFENHSSAVRRGLAASGRVYSLGFLGVTAWGLAKQGPRTPAHMSHSLNSLKGGYMGDYVGDYYRGYQGGY